jgi:hypothetical protein
MIRDYAAKKNLQVEEFLSHYGSCICGKIMKWIDMLFVLYYSIVPSWMQWDRCHECMGLDQKLWY